VARPSAGGFTLVEILAVLAILSLLMTFVLVATGRHRERGDIVQTQARIAELGNLITVYEVKKGDFPPDHLKDLKIQCDNDLNEGIEACVAALHGKEHPTGVLLTESMLGNTDGDQTGTDFHREGSPFLVEVLDSWDNPIAYFHNASYENASRILMEARGDRDGEVAFADAVVSDVTGVYANADTYQLISAGPDEEFGTEDDITNF
jgi:prepilin-type N-terminal cleavage/methylation domain-containing protein